MVTSKKVKGRAISMPQGVGYGLATAVLISVSMIAVLVGMILAGKVNETHVGYFVMIILLLSSFNGSLLSAIRVKRRMMLVSGIVGMAYFLMLLLATAVAFGGQFEGVWMSGLMILIGSVSAGGLVLRLNRKAEHGYKKYNAG